MKRVLLVGAGPTASLIAYNITKHPKLASAIQLFVWEASGVIGGRFSTIESPSRSKVKANLGAQYLTQSRNHPWSSPYFQSLLDSKLIEPLDLKIISGFKPDPQKSDFGCPGGLQSIVRHFFNAGIPASLTFDQNVTQVTPKPEKNVSVDFKSLISDTSGVESFDAVILTIPVPQIFKLERSNHLSKHDADISINLTQVEYTSRYALALFYDEKIHLTPPETTMNFLQGQSGVDPFVYWSVSKTPKGSAFVLHTSTDFAKKNEETPAEEVKGLLLEASKSVLKCIPDDKVPSHVICHRWDISQVKTGYPYSPGFVEFLQEPPILAAGDGFSWSGFEGCIYSAERTVERLRLTLL